jgi:hypothetical protein
VGGRLAVALNFGRKMKTFLPLLAAALLGCGNSNSGADGGGQDGGPCGTGPQGQDSGPVNYPNSINVAFHNINVHPAAAAALRDKNLTIPDVNGLDLFLRPLVGASDGGGALGPGVHATINVQAVTFTGVDTSTAIYGLVASIQQAQPATGFPTCQQVHSVADGGPTADAGSGAIVDWFVPVFQSAGSFSRPTGDLVNLAAYAVPASYISLLDCAAGQAPGTLLNMQGAILIYASVQPGGSGSAIGSISLSDGALDPFNYYADDYGHRATASLSGLRPNGVSTLVGVTGNGIVIIDAADPASCSTAFAPQSAWATKAGLFLVFFSPQ